MFYVDIWSQNHWTCPDNERISDCTPVITLFSFDFRSPRSQTLFWYLWNPLLSFCFYSSWSTLRASLWWHEAHTGTVRATKHSVCLISLVVDSGPDFRSVCGAQQDCVVELISIRPDKNRAADKEPLRGPSVFFFFFFFWRFEMVPNAFRCDEQAQD